MDEEKFSCNTCDRHFKSKESLEMHNSAKHSQTEKKHSKVNYKKVKNYGIFIIISALIIFGFYYMFSSIEVLPPTDMLGHVEQSPLSHILKEQMPIAVQKHMLEHVDGIDGGRGGVIINYNCKNYDCEEGLIENLESFGYKYNYVYVSPFKGMDAKIALTKLNRIEILEDYDEKRIDDFIIGY